MSAALVSAAGCVLYALLGEPRNLRVEEVAVTLPGWPAEVAPARVVLLADLHAAKGDGDWVDEQVRVALALQPEVVILLGDYHKGEDDSRNMPMAELARRLAPLRKQCPVYFVRGNHDRFKRATEVKRHFKAQGFTDVESADAQLNFANGCRALLRGFSYRHELASVGSQRKRFSAKALPADQPLLVASHTPWHFMNQPLHGALVVCGHTHGGMVCYPGGRPVSGVGSWTGSMLRGGLHQGKVPGQQIYISRGSGSSSFPVRIFCPPEITLLLLGGADKK